MFFYRRNADIPEPPAPHNLPGGQEGEAPNLYCNWCEETLCLASNTQDLAQNEDISISSANLLYACPAKNCRALWLDTGRLSITGKRALKYAGTYRKVKKEISAR